MSEKMEQYFYKYTVMYCEEVDGNWTLKTIAGLTFGKTYNEVCTKLTDYFGEDRIEEMHIEFASDCDVLEEWELAELFGFKAEERNIADEIKTGLNEAIEYEKGNLNAKTTTLSTYDTENVENNC